MRFTYIASGFFCRRPRGRAAEAEGQPSGWELCLSQEAAACGHRALPLPSPRSLPQHRSSAGRGFTLVLEHQFYLESREALQEREFRGIPQHCLPI